jgi:hypothetical protein
MVKETRITAYGVWPWISLYFEVQIETEEETNKTRSGHSPLSIVHDTKSAREFARWHV